MLTLEQVRWARRHDWWLGLAVVEEGFAIEALDEVVAGLEEQAELERKGYATTVILSFAGDFKPYVLGRKPVVFTNWQALRSWAGY